MGYVALWGQRRNLISEAEIRRPGKKGRGGGGEAGILSFDGNVVHIARERVSGMRGRLNYHQSMREGGKSEERVVLSRDK